MLKAEGRIEPKDAETAVEMLETVGSQIAWVAGTVDP